MSVLILVSCVIFQSSYRFVYKSVEELVDEVAGISEFNKIWKCSRYKNFAINWKSKYNNIKNRFNYVIIKLLKCRDTSDIEHSYYRYTAIIKYRYILLFL